MSNTSVAEGKETLKLTGWELGNLHLPPVTTVTLYEGPAPVEFLRDRIESMLQKNPWITSRIEKKYTTDGVTAMTYANGFSIKSVVERHFKVYKSGEVGLSLGLSYGELVVCLLPLQCVRSKSATDEDEVLFKVSVVPVETGSGDTGQLMPL